MDGAVNLFKPRGITSAKALYRFRRISGIRKSGHTGTLDPAAEGVLVICTGRGTRLVEQIMNLPKVYRATARLDVTSASFDSDTPLEPVRAQVIPDANKLERALAEFVGDIEQAPPAFSALKIGGVPAYKLARQQKPPRLGPRRVRVYWLAVRAYEWPSIEFEMACGRGTYVRALIRDLGLRLGTGGCLTGLQRRAVGPFHIEDAWTFEKLETAAATSYILPLDELKPTLARSAACIPARPRQE